jgi:hypothetical protein
MKEVTFGVIPGSGNPKNLRITGETLDFTVSKEQSKEINSTRTITSVVPVTAAASGGVSGEVSYQEWDELMAATLQSSYVVYGTSGVAGVASTFAYTATTITNSVTALSTTDLWTGNAVSPVLGQWFQVQHPGNANDKKLFRISTSVAPTATVITLDASTPATVVSATAGGRIATSRLTHGIAQSSFTLERNNADIGRFMAYRGMTPSKMSVGVSSGSLSTISFDFMGKDATIAASDGITTQLPGTAVASYSYDIHSGVTGASCVLWEGGLPITGTFVKSISMDFDNTLRSQEAICTLGAISIGSGTISISGSMSVYFADLALFTKFKNNTNSSIIFSSIDTAGNGYVFTIPVANISTWKTNASGKDTDMMVDIQFIGLRDAANAVPALQKAIFIDRIGVAAV